MLLVLHLIFAFTSIPLMLMAALAKHYRKKSEHTLVTTSSISMVGLIASGSILVIVNHLAVTSACLEGALYLAVFGLTFAVYTKTVKSRAD